MVKSAQKSIEDYLKVVYSIQQQNGNKVSTSEISQTLNVAPASVTEMLKKLSEKGYIEYSPYHGTTLTSSGLTIAEKTTRKHRLLERFLHDMLKIDEVEVHSQACEMEHALSDEAEESLCRLLKHPDKCPDDGKIIPACNLPFSTCEECVEMHSKGLEQVGRRQQNLVSICNLKAGTCAKVSFIRGEHRVLQRLLDMGLTPGTPIKVERAAPLKGPVEVSVRGSKVALGQDIAANVFVENKHAENRV
ncbi:MAG: metal-dependent transcriptional regulator [Thaumarchaeota archaeon]|nr:metal-dependent transcriptional regulator [Nitrososphaerota archaeon]MCL5319041.1 metal-dependent transcriptional regulator [Nitrososphaerota archaeon]